MDATLWNVPHKAKGSSGTQSPHCPALNLFLGKLPWLVICLFLKWFFSILQPPNTARWKSGYLSKQKDLHLYLTNSGLATENENAVDKALCLPSARQVQHSTITSHRHSHPVKKKNAPRFPKITTPVKCRGFQHRVDALSFRQEQHQIKWVSSLQSGHESN